MKNRNYHTVKTQLPCMVLSLKYLKSIASVCLPVSLSVRILMAILIFHFLGCGVVLVDAVMYINNEGWFDIALVTERIRSSFAPIF